MSKSTQLIKAKLNGFARLLLFICLTVSINACRKAGFNEQRAFGYIEKQLAYGYRIPGSEASKSTSEFIRSELLKSGWKVSFQDFQFDGIPIRNIIAKNKLSPPEIIFGTHYDTRQTSDNELEVSEQMTPVPGANDGASGTAVLLELSYHLSNEKSIWLVFFDAEDQGRINGWPWSLGADFFVQQLETDPNFVVIVDMVGDKNLEIYIEQNSNLELSTQIWGVAQSLGYNDIFIKESKYAILDDHIPFFKKELPAILIIDFDYPFWHTNEDTLDKVSGKSLKIIGDVLLKWVDSLN